MSVNWYDISLIDCQNDWGDDETQFPTHYKHTEWMDCLIHELDLNIAGETLNSILRHSGFHILNNFSLQFPIELRTHLLRGQ